MPYFVVFKFVILVFCYVLLKFMYAQYWNTIPLFGRLHSLHCLPSGLVQLAVVWCAGKPGEESAVSTECCRSLTHQCTQM